jgi:hypothetical protein
MDVHEDLVAGVRLMLLQVLAADVVIHLTVILPRLRAVRASGEFPRIVTTAMALSILAIVAGAVAVRAGALSRRTAYRLLVALMLAEVLAWVVFHNTGTAGGHTHDTGLLTSVRQHLAAGVVEGVAKTVELLAAALAVVLLRIDAAGPRGRADAGRGEAET